MKPKPTGELEAQRAVLVRQLRQAGPLIEGSIALVSRKCGSPSCPCAQGVATHQAMILCKKVNGRSVATYVPKALWEQVREWNVEHKKIKRVLKELSVIGEQIIRNHVGDQRQAQRVRKSLKVVEPQDAYEAMTLEQAIAELTFKDEQVQELARQNETLDRTVVELRQQIALLQRRLYGPRSEKYHPDQLFLDDVLKAGESESPVAEPPKVLVKATERRKAQPHGRLKLPEHLERVEEVLDLPEDQKRDPQSGEALVKLRDETSEKLAWKPGQWYVRLFIRPVYVHPDRQNDERAGVYVHPMPEAIIERCKADTSVLALVGVKKFVDHLPLYRQREIFLREGIDVAPSTLNAWAIDPILACEPLYNAFRADVLARPVLFTDDTPVDMLQEGRGRTKEARIWVYVGGCGPPYRFFDFTEDRRKERPAQILSGYTGFVQADAYAGYDHLFTNSNRIVEVGCWAHARRKWDEALTAARLPCTDILLRIRTLYKIEAAIRLEPAQRRLEVRQAESLPLLDKLYERVAEIACERVILPSSLLAKAVGYTTNQRKALYCYTTDGRLEIDNNTAENAIRPLALGRKNFLFVGSPRGGKACAMALTFLQSAKAVGANPYEYLHDIYNRLLAHPANRIHELLPAAWLRARANR